MLKTAMRFLVALFLVGVLGCAGGEPNTPAAQLPGPAAASEALAPSSAGSASGGGEAKSPASPEQPVVEVDRLGEAAMEYVRTLSEDLGPRDSESGGEARAAAYLERELQAVGLNVRRQGFSIGVFSRAEPRLSVVAPSARDISAEPMGRTDEGTVEARLVFAGLGRSDEIPAEGFGGGVALFERGVIRFHEKAENARRAGAVAAVVYNNAEGPLFGSLASGVGIPVVGIARSEGESLRVMLERGDVVVRVAVKRLEIASQNVVAETTGGGPGVVIIGGHYDSVPAVPGANDNASGTAVLLVLAKELTGKRYPFAVRVIGFGGEELGLQGSRAHVASLTAEERRAVRAVLNLDVVGAAVPLGVSGTGALTQLVRDEAARAGIALEPILEDVPSDHLSFVTEGIPAVIITTPDFSVIHTPEDTRDRIVARRLGQAAALVLGTLDALARTAP